MCEWGDNAVKLNTKPCCTFSEQEVADCTRHHTDTCARGGEPHDGVMWTVNSNNGSLNTEAQHPYVSGDSGHLSICTPQPAAVKTGVHGYGNVSQNEVALAKALVAHPVLSIGIDAQSLMFQFYAHGVYDNPDCHSQERYLDHGVAVVGYGHVQFRNCNGKPCKVASNGACAPPACLPACAAPHWVCRCLLLAVRCVPPTVGVAGTASPSRPSLRSRLRRPISATASSTRRSARA